MTEIHLYVAEDGTEFEDELECMAYEAGQVARMLKGQVVLLTEVFQPIPLDDLSMWDNTWYIFVKDLPTLHALRNLWDENLIGRCVPRFLFKETPGLFAYDENTETWYNMDIRLQTLQTIMNKAMSVIDDNI